MMKAPRFDYVRARTLDETFDLLHRVSGDIKLLAGGQTLLATLNMRLSEPSLLIDINGLNELRGISVRDGCLRIGALETHTAIESSELVARHVPLFAQAVGHIAHRAIRNLGTLGGSLCYADPAAEWPACALALDATMLVSDGQRERRVAAADFFTGLFATALAPDELLMACEVPLIAACERHDFDELARRHGDYAMAGLAAAARVEAGVLDDVRLAYLSLSDRPVRARATERLLQGRHIDDHALDEAEQSLRSELAPDSTPGNSAATKLQLSAVLARRALKRLAAP